MTKQYAAICKLRCSTNKTKFHINRTASKHVHTTEYSKACLQRHSSTMMSVTVSFVQVGLFRPYCAVLLHCWEQVWCITGRNRKIPECHVFL
jgi:hypothetical protein